MPLPGQKQLVRIRECSQIGESRVGMWEEATGVIREGRGKGGGRSTGASSLTANSRQNNRKSIKHANTNERLEEVERTMVEKLARRGNGSCKDWAWE